jgi:hypothetical protein
MPLREFAARAARRREMKTTLGLVALALSALIAHGEVLAEDATSAPIPNLVGTWTGPFKAMREHGVADGSLTLRVIEQDGPLLKAEKSWKSPGAPGDVGGKEVEEATEPLVGVIDFDGMSVHLAEQADNGLYSGRLTAPDTLELVYIEAGHAAAYRVRLTRGK